MRDSVIGSTQSTPPHIGLTQDDFTLLKRIKASLRAGRDVEIKCLPNGKIKVMEVTKKNISVE